MLLENIQAGGGAAFAASIFEKRIGSDGDGNDCSTCYGLGSAIGHVVLLATYRMQQAHSTPQLHRHAVILGERQASEWVSSNGFH